MGDMPAVNISLDGKDYVILPKNEYYRLLGKAPPDAVDALEFATRVVADDVKAAREAAGLTQAQLAKKMGISQPMVSGAERGTIAIGEEYVMAVLKVCKLPKGWKP